MIVGRELEEGDQQGGVEGGRQILREAWEGPKLEQKGRKERR